MMQRQLPLPHRLRREPQRLGDILRHEIRQVGDDLGGAHAISQHRHHGGDRDAKTPDTGQTFW